MDYERQTDSAPSETPSESETPAATGDESEVAAHQPPPDVTSSAESAAADAPDASDATDPVSAPGDSEDNALSDLGSDADVLDDSFAASPKPPEWPAADLATSSDMGDDSDAPVLADATTVAPAASDHVDLNQAGMQSITASSVTLSQGGAGQVHADEMHVSQSGVGLARVGNLTLGDGASAFAVVADQATVEEGSNAFLVVARSFSGEVRPTIDWRSAMAFGAGLGLVVSILRRLR